MMDRDQLEPLRIDGHVRVEQVEAWAKRRASPAHPVCWWGLRAPRESSAAVVYYTDRFGRSLIDGLVKIRRQA
jgi:hypothetical protein